MLKHPMQRHLALSCLGLQQAHPVGLDADEATKVALRCDVLRHEPAELARAHTCEETEEKRVVQHPVLGDGPVAETRMRQ